MKEKNRIYSLAGLKVLAVWLIFWWHSWLKNPPCDLGARCCEFFFVASGFLVFYTHKENTIPCTWKSSAEYVLRKLINLWPMHFLAFCLCLCILPLQEILTLDVVIRGIINLLFFQSWINIEPVFFSFNGPSWFLSSLLFCYFVTPVLLRLISNKRRIIILFPAVFFIRYILEEVQLLYPGIYWNINIHVAPIVRMTEFFLGIMTGCLWYYVYKMFEDRFRSFSSLSLIGFSIIEIFTLISTYILFVTKQNLWGRYTFVLWFCIVIIVFAFDCGFISRLMTLKPMVWFASIQLEFYIFHVPTMNIVAKYAEPYGLTNAQLAAIAVLSVLLLSCVYHYILKKYFEGFMQKNIECILNWFINSNKAVLKSES